MPLLPGMKERVSQFEFNFKVKATSEELLKILEHQSDDMQESMMTAFNLFQLAASKKITPEMLPQFFSQLSPQEQNLYQLFQRLLTTTNSGLLPLQHMDIELVMRVNAFKLTEEKQYSELLFTLMNRSKKTQLALINAFDKFQLEKQGKDKQIIADQIQLEPGTEQLLYNLFKFLSSTSFAGRTSLLYLPVFMAIIEQKNYTSLQDNLQKIITQNYFSKILERKWSGSDSKHSVFEAFCKMVKHPDLDGLITLLDVIIEKSIVLSEDNFNWLLVHPHPSALAECINLIARERFFDVEKQQDFEALYSHPNPAAIAACLKSTPFTSGRGMFIAELEAKEIFEMLMNPRLSDMAEVVTTKAQFLSGHGLESIQNKENYFYILSIILRHTELPVEHYIHSIAKCSSDAFVRKVKLLEERECLTKTALDSLIHEPDLTSASLYFLEGTGLLCEKNLHALLKHPDREKLMEALESEAERGTISQEKFESTVLSQLTIKARETIQADREEVDESSEAAKRFRINC